MNETKKVRLMDTPTDYETLGVNEGPVEAWEDRRRDDDRPGHWEWWYFDSILDDGSTVLVQFLQKSFQTVNDSKGHPSVSFRITCPDGTHFETITEVPLETAKFGNRGCDVHYGPHSFSGDLKEYDIHVDPVDGIAADLHLSSRSTPFRPGTAFFDFGGGDYFTWLCVVPKGEVTGTLTYGGQTHEVHGTGYHDHQWGSFFYLKGWNNWTWARQSYDDYSLLVFDLFAAKPYGYERFPICFMEDAKGKIVFMSTDGPESYEVIEDDEIDDSGKPYPQKSRYVFRDGAKVLSYELTAKETLQAASVYAHAPAPAKAAYDAMGIQPSYARFKGDGAMVFEDGANRVERDADLIYEFMYPGADYRDALDQQVR